MEEVPMGSSEIHLSMASSSQTDLVPIFLGAGKDPALIKR